MAATNFKQSFMYFFGKNEKRKEIKTKTLYDNVRANNSASMHFGTIKTTGNEHHCMKSGNGDGVFLSTRDSNGIGCDNSQKKNAHENIRR